MLHQENYEIFKEEISNSEKKLSELKNEIESWFQIEEKVNQIEDKHTYFEKLTQKEELTDEEMKLLIDHETKNFDITHRSLNLKNLKNITDKQCKELSKFEWRILILDWLTKISDKQASYLSKFKWTVLWLNWLVEVSDKQIKQLSKFEWHELRLDWLNKLTDKQATYLSESCRTLSIGWVKTITKEQLNQLIKNKFYESLDISWLENITEPLVEILENFEWKSLYLNENSLTDEQKKILGEKLWDKLVLEWTLYNTHEAK